METLLIMENHGIVFLNFCGNPGMGTFTIIRDFDDLSSILECAIVTLECTMSTWPGLNMLKMMVEKFIDQK